MGESKEKKVRRKSLQHLRSLQDEGIRDDIRNAVASAAQQALENVCISLHGRSAGSPSKSGKAVQVTANVSYQRNSRRYLESSVSQDAEEVDPLFSMDELISDPNLQLPATTVSGGEGGKDKRAKRKKRRWSILYAFKPKKLNPQLQLTPGTSNEAWMCGVCSKSFSSFDAAQIHEDAHIKEVIKFLGFGVFRDDSLGESLHNHLLSDYENKSNQKLTPIRQASESGSSSAIKFHHNLETPQNTSDRQKSRCSISVQPRPDILRLSSPQVSFSSKRLQPYNTPALQRKRKSQAEKELDESFSSQGDFYGESDYSLTTCIVNPSGPMAPIAEHRKSKPGPNQALSIDVPQEGNSMELDEGNLLLPHGMRDYVVLIDESLVDVCEKAKNLMLTDTELDAELELRCLAQDKAYYDWLDQRAVERRRSGAYHRFRAEGKSILSKVQNKFVDAYQLMKEGNSKRKTVDTDHYKRRLKGNQDTSRILENNKHTLYMNVIVKASIGVVNYELQRLAKQRWEAAQAKRIENDPQAQRFQQFRAVAQDNLVKLAGMALAADFTPRRIAVQLSNDLYRLLTPQLKRRGVAIETEIEYRVGPYFVLAVNVKKVDWRRLVKTAYRDVAAAQARWKLAQEERINEETIDESPRGVVASFFYYFLALMKLTKFDIIAQILAWCYHLHWMIYTPICVFLYKCVMGGLFRKFFLVTVSDEIFKYVEQKGMEMDIDIRSAKTQASSMLSALRKIRADGKELKKKQEGNDTKDTVLGPLLGPAMKEDNGPAPPKPEDFEMPDNLEFVGLETELSVGYFRLRWALLSSKSVFVSDAVFKVASKYENISVGEWSKHDDLIGLGNLPENVSEEDIVGAEKKLDYVMPKSAFVKANICHETAFIDMYNDYCFVLRKKALTPDVPYGSTFVAWTKYVVINTGSNSCKLICSVEAEFPNGPPMISRQIKNGMRAGVTELFVKTGETINKYSDHFP